ncbi:MAG: VWA domain-containing protein [Verrucomicrobiota bacterium]|nr:VWA domain-containing protein [Verrucomicrobiota bacterium]
MSFYHLHSPWYILMLIPLLICGILAFRKRPPSIIFSSLKIFKSTGKRTFNRTHIPLILQIIGIVFLIYALMRPQKGIERFVEKAEGIDIMLLLDVSGSMKAYDVPASIITNDELERAYNSGKLKNRMMVAKNELKKFVERRPNDRIGLIAFSGHPYSVCPPTLDHDFLTGHLKNLESGMLTDGTGIASPVAIGTSQLKDSKSKRKIMVLFTDGENNVDTDITPRQAAKLAKTFDLTLYTVGVGSDRAVFPRRSFFGGTSLQAAPNSLDSELLEDMADATGGRFFKAEDSDGFKNVMEEIDKLETTSMEQPRYLSYKERFTSWLLAGMILILLSFLLEYTLTLKIP